MAKIESHFVVDADICMFEPVKFTLRAKLALMYGALIALTMVAFAVIAYITVSSELMANLDTSLSRASSSLLAVLKREQAQVKRPLSPRRLLASKKTPVHVEIS